MKCDLFSFGDIAIAGVGCDIAGAIALAWSLYANSPEKIARRIPFTGTTFGYAMPLLARTAARQRAEARVGIVFLVGGFVLQGLVYFFPHRHTSLSTWAQRTVALAIIAVIWGLAAATYWLYVPWAEKRTYEGALDTLSRSSSGAP